MPEHPEFIALTTAHFEGQETSASDWSRLSGHLRDCPACRQQFNRRALELRRAAGHNEASLSDPEADRLAEMVRANARTRLAVPGRGAATDRPQRPRKRRIQVAAMFIATASAAAAVVALRPRPGPGSDGPAATNHTPAVRAQPVDPSAAGPVVAYLLTPSVERGSSGGSILVLAPSGPTDFRLPLGGAALPGRYVACLEDPDGRCRWKSGELTGSSASGSPELVVRVPASVLAPGDYLISVRPASGDQAPPIADYAFGVRP